MKEIKYGTWKLTDDDSYQWVLPMNGEEEEQNFMLIEMSLSNPTLREFSVYFNIVRISDYFKTEESKQELSCILSAFGYGDDEEDCEIILERMKKNYGKEVYQVACECVFEYFQDYKAQVIFIGTEEAGRKYIDDFVARFSKK